MKDLFKDLKELLGCEYISDLRFQPFCDRAQALMRRLDLRQYPLSALADAAEYLYGKKQVFADYEAAQRFFSKEAA